MKRVLGFLGLAALCCVGLNALAAAKIGDAEYSTIQDAVNAADVSSGPVTITVTGGTYNESVNLTKPGLKFKDADVEFYGRLTVRAAEGETVILNGGFTINPESGNYSDVSIVGITMNCGIGLYLEMSAATGVIRNILVSNCVITASSFGVYVNAGTATNIAVQDCTINGASNWGVNLGGINTRHSGIVVSGNTFQNGSDGVALFGSVENSSVTDNTFTGTYYGLYVNNKSGIKGLQNPIEFAGNAINGTAPCAVALRGGNLYSDAVSIGNGNTYNGEAIDSWAGISDNAIVISDSLSTEDGYYKAVYFNNKLYLGDETAFKTLDALVAANPDEESIAILNYDSAMVAPEGWEFKTEGDVTKLVALPRIVEVISADGGTTNKYASLAKAFAAAPWVDRPVNGKTVRLLADIDLEGAEWTPVSFCGTFDGNGKTISNLKTGTLELGTAGFFGGFRGDAKNVTFVNAEVVSGNYAGVFAAQVHNSGGGSDDNLVMTLENIKILNSKVTGMQKCGGLIGFMPVSNGRLVVRGCTVDGLTFDGADPDGIWQTGGIVGYLQTQYAEDADFINNTVRDITFVKDGNVEYFKTTYRHQFFSSAFIGSIINSSDRDRQHGKNGYGTVTLTGNKVEGTNSGYQVGPKSNTFIGDFYTTDEVGGNVKDVLKIDLDGEDITLYVAQVAGAEKPCKTIAEAMESAEEGDTVNLIYMCDENVSLKPGVQFKLNGKAYSGTVTSAAEGYQVEYDAVTGTWSCRLPVAKVVPAGATDGEKFGTFAGAVAAAQNGDSIVLLRDADEAFAVAGKILTLDFAGKKLAVAEGNVISVSNEGELIVVDSVGGGKVLGAIDAAAGCTLKIRAGTYAVNPSAWVTETDEETGRALYVVIPEGDLFKVQQNQIDMKTPDPTDVEATDENGEPIPDEEQADAEAAIAAANVELKETMAANSAIDTGLGKDERLVIRIVTEVAVVRTVETAAGTVKEATFPTLVYDVKPVVTTYEQVGDEEPVKTERQKPNEEITDKITFRLPIKEPSATGAYVRHIGHGEFEDETFFCKVQGPADGRYVELTVDHFSEFEVSPTAAVVVETEDAVGIVNLGVPGANKELAAAVPFLKSGVAGTEATLDDLIVTGRANGDTVTFQNAGTSATLSGDVWSDEAAKAPGTAFWYRSVGSSVPLALAGLVPASASTEVAPNAATLLVNPYNSKQDILAAVVSAAAEGDQIALVGGDVRYVKTAGGWGHYVKSPNNTEPGGVYVANAFVPAASLFVDGGKGVWYISKNGTAPTVEWTSAGAASASERVADGTVPTYGAFAWGVALDVEEKAAFAPTFARLVAYAGDAEVGGYTRQLADVQLADVLTTFLGADGWTWSDLADAKFAVRLLDGRKRTIVESAKVGLDGLSANLAWTYAGSTVPTTASAAYSTWAFAVSDSGEFESLKETFAGKGVVSKTADGYKVTLTNDMEGVVTLKGRLGNVTLDLDGHNITGEDGMSDNTAGGNAIEIVGAEPGANPTILTVLNGNAGKAAQIAGGKGASTATGLNGGAAIFVDPALADVRVNVTGPNAQSARPLVKGGDAGVGYVSATGAAGPAISSNAGTVDDGMSADGAAGELHKAWAWCTGDVSGTVESNGFETAATGTNWFFRTENGGAAFDFAKLSGKWTGDGTIHFVAGEIDVDGLKDTGYNGDLKFVGDKAGTTLKAISTQSVFAVTGVSAKRTWKNLRFTDAAADAANQADGGAISMVGGSLSVEGCTFADCVGGQLGGAVFAALLSGNSTITNSTFSGNAADANNGLGGAVYASAAAEDVALAVADSAFAGNAAAGGGAICTKTADCDAARPVALSVLRVTFEGNTAYEKGGAIMAEGDVTVDAGNATLDPVDGLAFAGEPTVFTNNVAATSGGAVEMSGNAGSGFAAPKVTVDRGVRFVGNAVSCEYDLVSGGALDSAVPGAEFVLTGVEFRDNVARSTLADGEPFAYGGAVAVDLAAKVLVDTCVFNDNDALCAADAAVGAGAVELSEVGATLVRNSTFRYSGSEAILATLSPLAITNCVLVGNGDGEEGGYADVALFGSACDMSRSAYGEVILADCDSTASSLAEDHNQTNCTAESVYRVSDDKAETLRLRENGFNPVAALGLRQETAYDFDGVLYGSKNVELGGSSMGAYEAGFRPLVVTLAGDKTYDGNATSNGCAWTWKLTDEDGNDATWDELGDVAAAFAVESWTFGGRDHGYYASTNDAPMTVAAELAGAEDLRFALRFRYVGTIGRRDVELGGLLVEATPDEYAYTGNPVAATVTVTDTNANVTLVKDVDYILTFADNVNPTDGAKAVVEGINNYRGVVTTNYFITAYAVEYSFDGVVDDALTEVLGAKKDDEVVAQKLAADVPGYAFDAHHSPTNGVVYRYGQGGDGAPAQLVLQVRYFTDSNGDGIPDMYQKSMKLKVVNGEWDGEQNGRDKTVWVTLTNDDGLWDAGGSGHLAAAQTPGVGGNADTGYAANSGNKWLTVKGGQLVLVDSLTAEVIRADSVPFFLYAYLKGAGGRHGRGGTGASLDLAGRYGIQVQANALTMNAPKKLATISVKANLVEAASGAAVEEIPLEGASVKVKAMETLGGPAEDLEVPVDGDGNVTVPAEGGSGFYQIGL